MLDSTNDYRGVLTAIVQRAEQMVNLLSGENYPAGQAVMEFIRRYGCEGYPADRVGKFTIGPWLGHTGYPVKQSESVTIVPCFSGDVPPAALPTRGRAVIPGSFLYTDQAIVLYNVDHWSIAELALTLLHEGRHALHRLGPKLANLPPLDPDDLHDTNTWLFTINLLVAWGGSIWEKAVQQEISWLNCQSLPFPIAPPTVCVQSGRFWPEIKDLFGESKHLSVRQVRQSLVSLQAHMLYWPQLNSDLKPGQICHSLVTHLYH